MATVSNSAVSSSGASSSSSSSIRDGGTMVSYAPTSSGVMRGWLGTATDPETHRLWFVLSSETLSYYESEESTDPLGMLGIDEMSSVKASKKSHKQYHMTISLTPMGCRVGRHSPKRPGS